MPNEDLKLAMDRFLNLRTRMFSLIKRSLDEDGYCKKYEGAASISFPNYFDSDTFSITIKCYVLSRGREHHFEGKDLNECLNQFEEYLNESEYEMELDMVDSGEKE